jgi:hypothetical protein
MKLALILTTWLLAGFSAFGSETDFPGNSWPKDLICRQHDANNGSGIFVSREVAIRFHTSNDAEATLKTGMMYDQPIATCYTDLEKGYLLVKPIGGVTSGYSLTGSIQCLQQNPNDPPESKPLAMEVNLAKLKLYYGTISYDCRWEEFWN